MFFVIIAWIIWMGIKFTLENFFDLLNIDIFEIWDTKKYNNSYFFLLNVGNANERSRKLDLFLTCTKNRNVHTLFNSRTNWNTFKKMWNTFISCRALLIKQQKYV